MTITAHRNVWAQLDDVVHPWVLWCHNQKRHQGITCRSSVQSKACCGCTLSPNGRCPYSGSYVLISPAMSSGKVAELHVNNNGYGHTPSHVGTHAQHVCAHAHPGYISVPCHGDSIINVGPARRKETWDSCLLAGEPTTLSREPRGQKYEVVPRQAGVCLV